MEELRLDDAIAQLKILKVEYFNTTKPEVQAGLIVEMFTIIDNMGIPELMEML
tara:strand:- start:230 stop:388 length:159 start_codon:yes stop_codon:yes gene_type:complete